MPSACSLCSGKTATKNFLPPRLKVLRCMSAQLWQTCCRPLGKAAWQSLFYLRGRILTLLLPRSPLSQSHPELPNPACPHNAAHGGKCNASLRLASQIYGNLSAGEFQLIRQTLLIFFQDLHIRVSTFLKDKVQNSNGRFVLPVSGPVPWGTEVPGVIRVFNDKGDEVKRMEFRHGGDYVAAHKEGSFELYGDRVLKLGTNM